MAKKSHAPVLVKAAASKADTASAGFDSVTLNNDYVPARLPVGRVVGVWGDALMRKASGEIRAVHVDDMVEKGDVILTTQHGIVQLEGPTNRLVRLPGLVETDRALASTDDFEPPAAGLTGSSADGGLMGGVRIDRIAEAVTPQEFVYTSGTGSVAPTYLAVLPPALPQVTVSDVTVPESNGFAVFTVGLTSASTTATTLTLALRDGTATAANATSIGDYGSTGANNLQVSLDGGTTWTSSSSVTIPAGQTAVLVRTPLTQDGLSEGTENFTLTATPVDGGTTVDVNPATGTASILDSDPLPSLGINSVVVNEGAGTALFTVNLSAASGQTVTVHWTTIDGTATGGADFTTSTGTLTFLPGETSKVINIPILNDSTFEKSEAFSVTLDTSEHATIAQATGTGTIKDDGTGTGGTDDDTPVLNIVGPAVIDEAAGTATYSVTLSNPSKTTITVNYGTSNGSAEAGNDFTGVSGTLTFDPNDTVTKTITVPINNDRLFEGAETFSVNLSSASGAVIGTGTVNSTIVDDGRVLPDGTLASDDTPRLNIIGPAIVDEAAGTATYTVTLSNPSKSPVSVHYATANGGATAGEDYTAASGDLTFNAGDTTSKTITVPITNDNLSEGAETFSVTLSAAKGATIQIGSVTSTIVDDGRVLPDGGTANNDIPVLNIVGPAIIDEAAHTATYRVTISNPSASAVTVDYSTASGSATSGLDFTDTHGTLTFTAGDTTTKTITVPISNDNLFEGSEQFTVNLSRASGATIGTGSVTSEIVDDGRLLPDGRNADNDTPVLNLSGPAIVDEAARTVTYNVTLSNPSATAITVHYGTASGSATSGIDFTDTAGILTFGAGDTVTKTITVPITNDTLFEGAETFTVNLSAASGATIGTGTVTSTIVDDGRTLPDGTKANDDTPRLTIVGPAIIDEAAGTATYEVRLSNPTKTGVSVNYTTVGGSATSDVDFTSTSGQLNFAANDNTTQKIVVTIANDTLFEGAETFSVTLSGATGGAVIDIPSVTSTIVDDGRTLPDGSKANDDMPSLVITGPGVIDEAAGTVTYTVTMSNPSTTDVTVNYASSLGLTNPTATAGNDYSAVSGTLTFKAGTTTPLPQKITMNIVNDDVYEGAESLRVSLSNAVGATIKVGTVDSIIVDDGRTVDLPGGGTAPANDDRPEALVGNASTQEGGNLDFAVTLTHASATPTTVTLTPKSGTATVGIDTDPMQVSFDGGVTFVPVTGTTVTVPAGVTAFIVRVPTVADGMIEINESMTLAASTTVKPVEHVGTGTIIDSGIASVTVDESALPTGNRENAGQTTHGQTTIAVGGTSTTFDIAATPTTNITSGGILLQWSKISVAGTEILTGSVHTENGTVNGNTIDIIRIALNTSTGATTVDLLGPVDHAAPPVGTSEAQNLLPLSFDVTATTGAVIDTRHLVVNIVDDMPTVSGIQNSAQTLQNTNLMITMDISGSMAALDGPNGTTRLAAEIAAVQELIHKYAAAGDVRVTMTTFGTPNPLVPGTDPNAPEAQLLGTQGMTAQQALATLTALSGSVSSILAKVLNTDYEAAIKNALTQFSGAMTNPALHLADARNVSYFLSDGKPEGNTDAETESFKLHAATQTQWNQFLTANNIQSFAIGFGAQVSADGPQGPLHTALDSVSFDGRDSTDPSSGVIAVSNTTDLSTALGTTVPLSISGTLLGGLVAANAGAGADGGDVHSLSIGSSTYTYDAHLNTVSSTSGALTPHYDAVLHTLTVTVPNSGALTVNMDTGDYSFAPTGPTSLQVSYTIVDKDGDSASSTLNIEAISPHVINDVAASNSTITGTIGPDIIDGRDGNDTINGGAGNDIINGGSGSDMLAGGLGSDVFAWRLADAGTVGAAPKDTITDFDQKNTASGGDILDLRDILLGETPTTLGNYLHFETTAGSTTIHISSSGQFAPATNNYTNENQSIVLQGTDLSGMGSTDAQIIAQLMKQGNLVVDPSTGA